MAIPVTPIQHYAGKLVMASMTKEWVKATPEFTVSKEWLVQPVQTPKPRSARTSLPCHQT